MSVPEGAVQTLRGENLAAAAGRARVEVRGENRRVFQMRREGAEGRDANARRERVPGRGGTVRVRGVRVRAQGATGEYQAHSKEFFREHLRLVLDNDKNTTGTKERGGIGGEGDVDTDATVGSKDGFRAMHTRHELTRRDVRVVAETIRESTAAAEENLAIIRDDARRAADERDDAARRFALEMDAARHDFARRAKEVETLVDSSESELTDALANLWAESSDSRRWAERSLAPAGTLDDDASRAMDALNTAAVRQTDASRALGATLLSLAAAAAPALEVRAELEISARQQTEALAKLVSEAEWRAADRAVVAWERLGDVRENFKALVVPREHARAALEEKIAALEARRFVTAAEDALVAPRVGGWSSSARAGAGAMAGAMAGACVRSVLGWWKERARRQRRGRLRRGGRRARRASRSA